MNARSKATDKAAVVRRILEGGSSATKEAKRLKVTVAKVRGWVRREKEKKRPPQNRNLPVHSPGDPVPGPPEVVVKVGDVVVEDVETVAPDGVEPISNADNVVRESANAMGLELPEKPEAEKVSSPGGGDDAAPDQTESEPPPPPSEPEPKPPRHSDPGEALLFMINGTSRRAIRWYAWKKKRLTPENEEALQAIVRLTPIEEDMIRDAAPDIAPYIKKLIDNMPLLGALAGFHTIAEVFARRMEAVDTLTPAPVKAKPKTEDPAPPPVEGRIVEKG